MLATMPRTSFPGRTAHGFELVVTDRMEGSSGEHVHSGILGRRLGKRMPVSTFEFEEWGRGIGEGWRREWEWEWKWEVEIVVVVEWAVRSVEEG
jgi:hypothetical protein